MSKKYKIKCCWDCPKKDVKYNRGCTICLLTDSILDNLDVIHPDCPLEDY
jgi:hypothetical protein